jgi:hypothetical protein
MRHSIEQDRIPEGLNDMLLTDEFVGVKGLRPILAVERLRFTA